MYSIVFFFFSSRRRHTRYWRDWSSECALPICSGIRLFLPYSKTPKKCIFVAPGSGAGRQFLKLLNVATAQHDFFGLQSFPKLLHDFGHMLLPLLFAQAVEAPDAQVILKGSPVLVRQVSKLDRKSV